VVDGLLDGLPVATRAGLLDAIANPDAPWTLLLLTSDAALTPPGARVLSLTEGGLHA
jgi:hypothetical protein